MKCLSIAFLLLPWVGFSNPILHEIFQGEVRTDSKEHLLTITATDESIIHWKEFSIQEGETTRFIQPDAQSVVLNRIVDPNPSHILGRLESNGKILLINPNGVLVGKNSVIDTASFIASSLDLKSFQFNRDFYFEDVNNSSVVNLGTVKARSGDLFLFGAQAENHGLMEAKNGTLGVVAVSSIQLKPNEEQRIFSNNEMDSASYKATVSGTLRSHEIYVFGKTVEIGDGATIDAAHLYGGGIVKIGGDFQGKNRTLPIASKTYVAEVASIWADCSQEGDGGRVIVWSDDETAFWGSIFARGGAVKGNGGFVEISSPKHLIAEGKVDTTACNGTIGTLLLDPTDVTISNGPYAGIGTFPPPDYTFPGPAANVSTLFATTIQTYLLTNSVVVDATTGVGGSGSIQVLDRILWGPAVGTRLTLRSSSIILIRADILESSPAPFSGGSVVLIAPDGGIIDITAILPGISISAGSQNGITMVGDPAITRCMRSHPILQLSATGGGGTPSIVRLGFQIPPGGTATGPIDVTCFDLGLFSSNFALAAIGHGDSLFVGPSLLTTTPAATITVDSTGNIAIVTSNEDAMSAIGHGSYALDPNSNLRGDICVKALFPVTLLVQNAFPSKGNKAAIGHGAGPGSDIANASGNISVFVRDRLNMSAYESLDSVSIIGHFPIAGTAIGNIFVSVGDDIIMAATGAVFAASTNGAVFIGHNTSFPYPPITTVTSDISVSAGGNLCMRAGTRRNACGIGHDATTLSGIVSVSTVGNLTMINQNDDLLFPVFIGSRSINPSFTSHTFVAAAGNILLGENLSGSFCCPFSGACMPVSNGFSGQIVIRAPGDVNVATQSDLLAIGSNQGNLNSFISTLNDISGTTRICARGSILPQNGPAPMGTPFFLGVDNLGATDSSIDFRAGDSIQMLNNFDAQAIGTAYLSATTTFLPGQLWTTNTNQLTSVCGALLPPLTLLSCGACPSYFPLTYLPPFSPLLPPPVLCGSLPTNSILIQTKAGDITFLNPGLPVPPDTPVGFCSTCVPCQTLILGPFPNDIEVSTQTGTIFISTFFDIFVNQAVSTGGTGSIFIEACQDLFVNSTISITGAGTGNIELVAGRDLNISGVTIATNSGSICLSAFRDANLFQRILSNTGTITAQAGRNITIPTTVLVQTSNAILMIAGESLIMAGTARINSSGSSVTLVVDNLFPAPPLIGSGSLQMGSLSRIDALTTIRIFSAMQGLNSISGQFRVNSVPISFSPAVNLFADTNQEVSCTYVRQPLSLCAPYASPFSGCGIFPPPLGSSSAIPLTVFYKICLQQVTFQATKIVDEFLVDLHPYDEFPGWMEEFWIDYRNLPITKATGRLASWDILPNEAYYFRRRLLNVFNYPKSWTQLLPYAMDQ